MPEPQSFLFHTMREYQAVLLMAFYSLFRFGQCAEVQGKMIAQAIVPTVSEEIGINPISGLVPI